MSSNTESSRLEDDGPDDDDDGQRRRKRPKKVTSKEGSDKAGLYQVHPLKIVLHVYDDETSDTKPLKLVVLKFEYFLKLNVVCVGAEGSPDAPEKNIFCNLFPDDAGLEPPHQVNFVFFVSVFSYMWLYFVVVHILTCLGMVCSRPSSFLVTVKCSMRTELQGLINGYNIWRGLISYRKCRLFYSAKILLITLTLLKVMRLYLISHCIASSIGWKQFCKEYAHGKKRIWLLRESLHFIFLSF